MRIAQILTYCSPSSGIGRCALALSEGAAASGHSVHYIHSSPRSVTIDNVQFHRLGVVHRPRIVELLQFGSASRRAVRAVSVDIQHTHGEVPFGNIVTAHSCHRVATRVRMNVEGRKEPGNFGIVDRMLLHIERILYTSGRGRWIIAVSRGVKRELEEMYNVAPENIIVIPNGVDFHKFELSRNSAARTTIRSELRIHGDDPVLLLVANEFRRKGVHIVLESMALLKGGRPWLVVVGGDDPREYLHQARRAGILSRVRFVPRVDAIERYFAAADLFVMPSYYEAFSLATLEAAASGLPLVVTRVNGTEDLVQDGKNGIFVHRDADDVASKIGTLLSDQARLLSMGAKARESAKIYDWSNIVPRVLAVYRNVAEAAS